MNKRTNTKSNPDRNFSNVYNTLLCTYKYLCVYKDTDYKYICECIYTHKYVYIHLYMCNILQMSKCPEEAQFIYQVIFFLQLDRN